MSCEGCERVIAHWNAIAKLESVQQTTPANGGKCQSKVEGKEMVRNKKFNFLSAMEREK